MIGAAIRRGLLANFPPGTPLAVVAPRGAFDELVAARNDPATALHTEPESVPPASPHIVLEGLDAVGDPAELLARVRAAAPHARLFALVGNAAHLPALAEFYAGAALAAARPLVRADVERALADAGWFVIALQPIASEAGFALTELPGAVHIGALTFHIDDAATLERVRPAALLAIADPA